VLGRCSQKTVEISGEKSDNMGTESDFEETFEVVFLDTANDVVFGTGETLITCSRPSKHRSDIEEIREEWFDLDEL
jgi:hypothetical protein